MFWDKKCSNCNSKIDSKWKFCPNCGDPLKEDKHDVFKDVDKDFQRIDKMFGMKLPKFAMKPIKTKGISITITSDNISPPKIEVRPSGNYKMAEPIAKKVAHDIKPLRIPKTTEEPETKIFRKANKQTIAINLPDVKSLDDIEIKRLENSIEIKAFSGDKAYFKLIPIPSNAYVNKEFKDGVLKIEVEK